MTTAAGIWATACIGIAIGYGYYVLGICAWLLVMVTLYILKNIDKMFFKSKRTIFTITVNNISIIAMIYNTFQKSEIIVKNMDIEKLDNISWKLSFFIVYDRRIILEELANELNNSKYVISVDYLH